MCAGFSHNVFCFVEIRRMKVQTVVKNNPAATGSAT